jgi:hypothetical protein
VATFVIETYLSRARASELEAVTARLRDAIAVLTIDPPETESPVRWLHSYYLAEDEVCLHILEAASADAALEVGRRAGLTAERIVEAEARGEEAAVPP